MVSRFPFASAFLSRSTKSSTTQRSQRSVLVRNLLVTGTPPTSYLQRKTRLQNNYNINDDIAEFSSSAGGGYNRPVVQWYPGHIAKAERQLSETLKAVDVVVEVRDARACKATAHPRVGEWCAGRPRIVVLTHLDMVPKAASGSWRKAYETLGAERWDEAPINRQVLFVNAKQGQGIHALHRAIFKAGSHVQERRERRGLNPRPLRVGIIGYPNVGKSALINKILGRKRAKTENKPGVTRSLQWIRLLDSPGIIPAKMVDQSDALLLAACNCIGEAAYDNQAVAAYLCEWLKAIHIMEKQGLAAPDWQKKCKERYGFDPLKKIKREDFDVIQEEYMTGEDMLFKVADNLCRGDAEDASRKILQDFRSGRMGHISLQLAPESEEDDGQLSVPIGDGTILGRQSDGGDYDEEFEKQEQEARARIAVVTAKERGLELPPIVDAVAKDNDTAAADVGKGMFDGW
eukprot:jgi/Psemu1/262113/estExt_Genewise1Plus.C_6880010